MVLDRSRRRKREGERERERCGAARKSARLRTSCDRASLARVTGGSCRLVRSLYPWKKKGRGKTVPGEGGSGVAAGYIAHNGSKWPNYRAKFGCVGRSADRRGITGPNFEHCAQDEASNMRVHAQRTTSSVHSRGRESEKDNERDFTFPA